MTRIDRRLVLSCRIVHAKAMPETEWNFVAVISDRWVDTLKGNIRVCKKLPIFVVNKTPIGGRVLQTFKALKLEPKTLVPRRLDSL
jgi:hypothetical protein